LLSASPWEKSVDNDLQGDISTEFLNANLFEHLQELEYLNDLTNGLIYVTNQDYKSFSASFIDALRLFRGIKAELSKRE
jgi:hypothetical protein